MINNHVKVIIEKPVYEKILYWVDKCKDEISGLGKVVFEDGAFVVKSAILVKQENTGADTEMDAQSVAKAMYELRNEPGHLNFWWHSHADMNVFWSSTDHDTIADFGKNGWCLAVVFNHRHEHRAAYYQKGTGFLPELFVDELEVENGRTISYYDESWDTEYKNKVTVKSLIEYGNAYYDSDDALTPTVLKDKTWWQEEEETQTVGKPRTVLTNTLNNLTKGKLFKKEKVKKGTRVVGTVDATREHDIRGVMDDPEKVTTYEDLTDDDLKYLVEQGDDKYQPYFE